MLIFNAIRGCAREAHWWLRMSWLTCSQNWVLVALLLIGPAVCGIVALTAPWPLWIAASLTIGIVCGHAVFAVDQWQAALAGACRAQTPLQRVWLLRTSFWLSCTVISVILFLMANALAQAYVESQSQYDVHWDMFFALHRWQIFADQTGFLCVWPLYGFAVGLLTSQVVRRRALALAVSLVLAAPLALMWLPSIIGGGLPPWQLLPTPLALLLASWGLLRPWANGHMHEPMVRVLLADSVIAALALLAMGLMYRAYELPPVEERFECEAYLAGLPRDNPAATLIMQALAELEAQEKNVQALIPAPQGPLHPPLNARPQPFASAPQFGFFDHLHEVEEHGWPDAPADLEHWLDAMFAGRWLQTLRAAAPLPLAMLHDPDAFPPDRDRPAWRAGALLVGRARQLRQREDREFALPLWLALALSRHLRNHATMELSRQGNGIEYSVLRLLQDWILKDDIEPAQLRAVQARLRAHEESLPSVLDCCKMELCSIQRNLTGLVQDGGWSSSIPRPTPADNQLILLARRFPWEAERERRQVQEFCFQFLRAGAVPLSEEPDDFNAYRDNRFSSRFYCSFAKPVRIFQDRSYTVSVYRHWSAANLMQLRALQIQAALLLHQFERGLPAASLHDLTPAYLPADVLDPWTDQPFGYRVSKGERLARGAGAVNVNRRQAILWSAGKDHVDHGGKVMPADRSREWDATRMDVIFVVPVTGIKGDLLPRLDRRKP